MSWHLSINNYFLEIKMSNNVTRFCKECNEYTPHWQSIEGSVGEKAVEEVTCKVCGREDWNGLEGYITSSSSNSGKPLKRNGNKGSFDKNMTFFSILWFSIPIDIFILIFIHINIVLALLIAILINCFFIKKVSNSISFTLLFVSGFCLVVGSELELYFFAIVPLLIKVIFLFKKKS